MPSGTTNNGGPPGWLFSPSTLGSIQMIVVVMAHDNQINMRKIDQCNRQRRQARRTGKADRAGAFEKMRVEQNVPAANLPQHARVAQPGHGRVPDIGFQVGQLDFFARHSLRPVCRMRGQQVVPLPAQKALADGRVVHVVVVKTIRPMVRLAGVVIRVGARAADQDKQQTAERDNPVERHFNWSS